MVFNSIDYFLFLGFCLVAFYTFPVRYRWWILLLASILFYATWSIWFLAAIFGITALVFLGSQFISKGDLQEKKSTVYVLLFLVALLPLLFFKYSGFITENIMLLFSHQSRHGYANILNLIVPIGLSYYTFQALSYLIDVRRGMRPAGSFPKFSLYMVFFPKLLMGPIERARSLLPQIENDLRFSENDFVEGLRLILLGLVKKLVIADRIAIYTSAVFEYYHHQSGVTLLVASLFYTVQLYADFSGYTDIALGSAKLFGINLTDNFNRPLLATSMTEFWRRWHITLTRWLTDYVFTPMAVRWRYWGKRGLALAAVITFIIIGIWHGAGWNFVIFGLLNGLALAFEIYTQGIRKNITRRIPKPLSNTIFITLTFLYFSFTLIFFNSPNTSDALSIIARIISMNGKLAVLDPSTFAYSVFGIILLFAYEFFKEFFQFDFAFQHRNQFARYLSYSFVVILILLIGVFDGGQFIYFKF